ncbi:DUF4376 domain-containing protein [Flagellatimonas centrodinii]|uniref:DUF4376 domain-containing protein n=1 Tax=Flagellatimonas centrodinii TaxID=2806210 RepID=UPI001FEFD7FF|nr:DUF4376 domain-containing protein [Flagellatimonas centrodinii]ULQ45977.1 DUF4376 domain-containing protein [Flagellatimonas centrodinii]
MQPRAGRAIGAVDATGARIGDTYADGQFAPVLLPLAEQQDALRAANSTRHTAAEAAGVPYAFPDGAGTAQTRDTRDLLNINGIASMAAALIAAGETGAVMPFRDAEDVTHMLTPQQAYDFSQAVGVRITALYQIKWQIRQQIDALPDAETAAAFDLDATWGAALQQL